MSFDIDEVIEDARKTLEMSDRVLIFGITKAGDKSRLGIHGYSKTTGQSLATSDGTLFWTFLTLLLDRAMGTRFDEPDLAAKLGAQIKEKLGVDVFAALDASHEIIASDPES